MSKENLEQFIQKVTSSEELQTRIGDEMDADSLIALGAEHGCEFTAEDLAENAELSDEELDSVAGGGREERQLARWLKRMVRAARKADQIGTDGRILWDTVGPEEASSTEHHDDGSGDPTKLN